MLTEITSRKRFFTLTSSWNRRRPSRYPGINSLISITDHFKMASRVPVRLFSFVGALRRPQTELGPVQRLFAEKVKDYQDKSKKNPGKLVDVTPEFETHVKNEKERLKRIYGGGDMSQFPKFDFSKSWRQYMDYICELTRYCAWSCLNTPNL